MKYRKREGKTLFVTSIEITVTYKTYITWTKVICAISESPPLLSETQTATAYRYYNWLLAQEVMELPSSMHLFVSALSFESTDLWSCLFVCVLVMTMACSGLKVKVWFRVRVSVWNTVDETTILHRGQFSRNQFFRQKGWNVCCLDLSLVLPSVEHEA